MQPEQNRLIIENMGMVEPIAAVYRGMKGVPFDELVASGREGLVRAADGWRERATFKTYAAHMIHGTIQNFIRDWQEFESLPGDEDEFERLWYEWQCFFFLTPFESWVSLAATPEDLASLYQEIAHRRNALSGAVIGLDRRERAIFTARYLREPQQTLTSIARDHRISYARTVFLLKRALKKLTEALDGKEQTGTVAWPA